MDSVKKLDSDSVLEDYLVAIDLYSQIPSMSIVQEDIHKVNQNNDGIPARSPARNMKKLQVPNSPEILDSSSVEYQSYGSDRSSFASIFSDNEDLGEDKDKIDLDTEDYEEILELLDYINADDSIVQTVDEVINIVGIFSGISPKKI